MDVVKLASDLYASAWFWVVSNPADAFLVALFLTILVAVLGVTTMLGTRGAVSRRLAGDTVSVGGVGSAPRLRYEIRENFWNQLVSAVEKRVPLIDEANRSLMRRRLLQAGFMGPGVVRNYYAIRFFMTICLPLGFLLAAPLFGASLSNQRVLFAALGLCIAGLYLPSAWLTRRIANRQQAISEGFPDALDMLVVCVESGLGLDQAITQVSRELQEGYPALSQEFAVTNLEMRHGKRRADALRNLGERSGVDDLKKLVSTLIQADRFGTSIAQTLRTHAEFMRVTARQRAEEKAAKIGIKLVFPIFFCILPSLFVVTVGPVVVTIFTKLIPMMNEG